MAKTVSISGKLVYKDKSPISGARIKIWDVDTKKKNKDDLILNVVTGASGRFSGSKKWHDGLGDILRCKYEVSFDGKTKKGNNILNPRDFFKELKMPWQSPKQAKISISGELLYKDGTPISGAKIQIWEIDPIQKNNSDDLIVNDVTDHLGKFSGSGPGKDSGGVQTFRYKVFHPKTNEIIEKTNKTKGDLNKIKTSWKSEAQVNISLSGKVVYKDKTPVKGAKIKIWEIDPFQKDNSDDLIVDMTTDKNGQYSGTGRGNDSGGVQTFRFKVFHPETNEVVEKTNKTKGDLKKISTGWKSDAQIDISLSGKVVYKDKTPVSGAKIKIWEMDPFQKNNNDDLIVDMTTDKNGQYTGTGRGNDSGGVQTFRYWIKMPETGKIVEAKNKVKLDLKKITTGLLSPEQRIIKGRLLWNDRTAASGVRIKIWETDNFRKNDSDDLIVNMVTDKNGDFEGQGDWRDDPLFQQIQTFRWEVSIPKINFKEESKTKEATRASLNFIRLKADLPGWTNWIDELTTIIDPKNQFRPRSENDLKLNIQSAVSKNLKIKAVGAGHSHSWAAKPYDFQAMFDLSSYSGELKKYPWIKQSILDQIKTGEIDNEPSVIKDYVRVKSGTSLRTIYRNILVNKNLGLINMGPFDAQKIAGLVNTNTHGSGVNLGGFSDMVRSVEMFVIVPQSETTNKVELWVIEPKNGISDPVKFKETSSDKFLVQNDDVFHSVVCGYGLFGIVSSYTLAVRSHYWMSEQTKPMTWKKMKTLLSEFSDDQHPKELAGTYKEKGKTLFQQSKIYINTAECIKNGGITDSVSVRLDTWKERKPILKPDNFEKVTNIHKIWPPMRKRTNSLSLVTQKFVEHTMTADKLSKPVSATEVSILKKFFFNKSGFTEFFHDYKESAYYRAIRRGRDNTLKYDNSIPDNRAKFDNTSSKSSPIPNDYGPSIEICVPLDQTTKAITTFMKLIADSGLKMLGPVGVRFTSASDHYLAPAYGRASAFIELAGLLPSRDMWDVSPVHGDKDYNSYKRRVWPEFRKVYNKLMFGMFRDLKDEIPGIRFHKGKLNKYNAGVLKAHYPDSYKRWIKVYHLFSSSGLLDCPNSVEEWKLDKTRPSMSKTECGKRLNNLKD